MTASQTMSTEPEAPVLYSATDGVATITLNRPWAANAIDIRTANHLRDAVEHAAVDPAVRVVLLTGAGERFCAGGDVTAMAEASDRSAFIAELADAAHKVVTALDALEKPVVVAVQGSAAGAGMSLVLGGDLVIATSTTRFVTAYGTIGLTPDCGMSWLLPRIVGQTRATHLLLTAEPISAQRALDLGIVSSLCPPDDLATTALETARTLAARPGYAIGATRALVRASWSHDLIAHLDEEAATITKAVTSEDAAALISQIVKRA